MAGAAVDFVTADHQRWSRRDDGVVLQDKLLSSFAYNADDAASSGTTYVGHRALGGGIALAPGASARSPDDPWRCWPRACANTARSSPVRWQTPMVIERRMPPTPDDLSDGIADDDEDHSDDRAFAPQDRCFQRPGIFGQWHERAAAMLSVSGPRSAQTKLWYCYTTPAASYHTALDAAVEWALHEVHQRRRSL
jgi:hypothetical protein